MRLGTTVESRSQEGDSIELEEPTLEDAKAIWSLVQEDGVLDPNSSYLYLLLCRDFSQTCLVAKQADRLIGFVTAYVPPQRSNSIFVWQIAVAPSGRRKGLAHRMLLHLIESRLPDEIRFLEATITPSNEPSRRLFHSIADRLGVPLEVHSGFSSECFPQHHEDEELVRIGPFSA